MNKNTPYVRATVKGKLINPITKNNPYVNRFPSVSEQKKQFKNATNNKKGVRLVVTALQGRAKKVINEEDNTSQWNVVKPSFTKFKIKEQLVKRKFPMLRNGKIRKFKRIYHYV